MSLAAVRPEDVDAYFRVALRIYRKRKPNLPKSMDYWRMISRRAVHGLLRFAQGEWPPGSRPEPVLSDFPSAFGEVSLQPASGFPATSPRLASSFAT